MPDAPFHDAAVWASAPSKNNPLFYAEQFETLTERRTRCPQTFFGRLGFSVGFEAGLPGLFWSSVTSGEDSVPETNSGQLDIRKLC